jgi:large subunit ribosomal protein L21e
MRRSHGKYVGKGRNLKSKGRLPITNQLREFKVGDKVRIDIDPHFADGMPHLHFNRKTGEVIGMQGTGVILDVKDINKHKQLVVTNVHLKKI